jgi:hypothetical protein
MDDYRLELHEWLGATFGVDDEEVHRVIEAFDTYLDSLAEPVAPGQDDSAYWEFFQRMLKLDDETAFEQIDELLEALEEER